MRLPPIHRLLRRTRKGIYHVSFPTMKHVENSLRGVAHAIRYMFAKIDLDLCITLADPHCPKKYHPDGEPCRGHVVGCHWPRPMEKDGFKDPAHQLSRATLISRMTLDEALRLEAGKYRMHLIDDLIAACGDKVIPLVEPKGDHRFLEDWPWQHMVAVAKANHATLEAYALPANAAALPVARRNGVKHTWIIGEKAAA